MFINPKAIRPGTMQAAMRSTMEYERCMNSARMTAYLCERAVAKQSFQMGNVAVLLLTTLAVLLPILVYFQRNTCHPAMTPENDEQGASTTISSEGSKPEQKLVPTKREPRILCWILTGVANHMKRAIHVKRTWGSRCDILLFMSSQKDDRLGTIALPGVEEGYKKLWPKTVKAFQYVWEHHRDEADWFMKADDDTWVFLDNLRSLLRSYDPKKAHFLGRLGATTYTNATYHYGGTGYLLSREGLRLFIEEALPHPEKCYAGIRPDFNGWEDAEMGNCMYSVSVFPETLFDNKGRNRLLTYNPAEYLTTTVPTHRTWKHILSETVDRPITYHKVRPQDMYVLEYLTSFLKQDR